MTGRRFQVTSQFTTIFADRVRIGSHDELGRFHLALHPGNPADECPTQALVTLDLPKVERAAYLRAAAAFNSIMDEAERAHEQVLKRWRDAASSTAGYASAAEARP